MRGGERERGAGGALLVGTIRRAPSLVGLLDPTRETAAEERSGVRKGLPNRVDEPIGRGSLGDLAGEVVVGQGRWPGGIHDPTYGGA